jgi:Flp pilus assembly pilin Flp
MFNDLKLYIQALVGSLAKNEEGQTLVEYALIISLVSVALVAALIALNGAIGGVFTTIEGSL